MRASFIVTLAATLCATAAVAVPIERRGGDGGRATFYYGHDLLDPACGGDAPTDDDLVAAVRADSPFKCGDKVGLWYKSSRLRLLFATTVKAARTVAGSTLPRVLSRSLLTWTLVFSKMSSSGTRKMFVL